jgi:hypothetical protein
MRLIYLLFISFILSNCSINRQNVIPYTEKERLANQTLAQVALKLRDEKGLMLCGTGGGMMNQISMLALAFNYHHRVTLEQGRELIISAVETFLSAINGNEIMRPYLEKYPFEPTNVEIMIFLKKVDGSILEPEVLHVIAAIEGKLSYDIEALDENNFSRLKTIHEETYEEALQTLKYTDQIAL